MIKIIRDLSPETHYYQADCKDCCIFVFTGDEIQNTVQYSISHPFIKCPQCGKTLTKDAWFEITKDAFELLTKD